MKISYNWLGTYLDHGLTPGQLAERLTMSGLEVEAVEPIGTALDGVVVGHVLAVEPHPDADRLSCCRVDVGEAEPLPIVCGAPNVAAGQKVPVARVNTTLMLPDRKDPRTRVPVTLKEARIRGAVSMGMICAEDELGLSDDHSGIMVLPPEAPVGQPLGDLLAAQGRMLQDTVLDVAITPNRPDAVCHLGVARDVAALTGAPLHPPGVDIPAAGSTPHLRVDVRAPEGCGRYVGLLVRGVTIRESPQWMKQRLEAIGLRPRNNVVDITNYVMYECGQPLHAFDYDQVAGQTIIVRFTETETPFTTLDGKVRTLPAGTLMIADGARDVAVAGVMGGENSEVTGGTTNVLIESAYFDPSTIRKTARALQLQTDASYRFERGVDPEGQAWAAARAAQLMVALAGGRIDPVMVDAHPRPVARRTVVLRPGRIPRILGVDVPRAEVVRLLTAIGFTVDDAGDVLRCMVPSFRPDVTREIDLIEEVGRLHGFENIPVPTHSRLPNRTPRTTPAHTLHRRTLALLSSLGYREIYTNSMLRQETAEQFNLPPLQARPPADTIVHTLNPISQEMATLRPSLLPGMLQVMRHNANHGQEVLRFLEFGHVFHRTEEAGTLIPGYAEDASLLLAAAGPADAPAWDVQPRSLDFFDLKGVVEALLQACKVPDVVLAPVAAPTPVTPYHLAVFTGEQPLGIIARLSDDLAEAYDLKGPVFFAELNWARLSATAAPYLNVTYSAVSRFPVVTRDLAVVIDRNQPVGPLLDTLHRVGGALLKQVQVFDLYEGTSLPPGKKSVAFSLRFGSDRTLKDAEVEKQMNRIMRRLQKEYDAELRQ